MLNDCRVRFSQRTVFEDDHELQPDYAIFGTASEIWQYAIATGFPLRRGGLPASVVVADLAANPKMQKMAIESLAKLFRNGRSQAVRLPREFRFEGDAVRVRRVPEGILLEPMIPDPKEWFAAMDKIGGDPLLKKGRKQPPAPRRKIFD